MKSFGAAANFGKTSTQFVNRCAGWSGGAPLRFQHEAGGGVHWLVGFSLVRTVHMVLVFWVGYTIIVSSMWLRYFGLALIQGRRLSGCFSIVLVFVRVNSTNFFRSNLIVSLQRDGFAVTLCHLRLVMAGAYLDQVVGV